MFKLNVDETVIISFRNVPKTVLKGLDILAVAEDTNRSEYVRRLLQEHVEEKLPEEMLKKL